MLWSAHPCPERLTSLESEPRRYEPPKRSEGKGRCVMPSDLNGAWLNGIVPKGAHGMAPHREPGTLTLCRHSLDRLAPPSFKRCCALFSSEAGAPTRRRWMGRSSTRSLP